MDINNLSSTNTINLGDNLALYIANQGDERKVSLTDFLSFINSNLNLDNKKDTFTTQYVAPNTTGFNVVVDNNSNNIWCVIQPQAGYATMTITLPIYSNLVDKQEILFNCTQSVTALTIDINGASGINGNPTTLSANGTFKLKYDKPFKTWYKVA